LASSIRVRCIRQQVNREINRRFIYDSVSSSSDRNNVEAKSCIIRQVFTALSCLVVGYTRVIVIGHNATWENYRLFPCTCTTRPNCASNMPTCLMHREWSLVISCLQPSDLFNCTNENSQYCKIIGLHCVPKNDTDVTHYRFNPHQSISVIFGRDFAERVCY